MGISLKIKIPIGSRRRPSKTSAGQNPLGEGSSRKQAHDHRSGSPPLPCRHQNPEPRPKPYIMQPRRPSYNTVIVRPSTAPQKPRITTHAVTTTTPSSHRHRRPSKTPTTPRSPVSPLETSRFEFPSPYSRPQPAVQRDEYGFSIRTPSTPAGQANTYGMSALAPVNSDEWSYFEPQVGSTWKGGEEEKSKGREGVL
ncbi:hypothetical protein COCVIDRAFT_95737 [Bipolaris victoriae FI3]|uniref:Uncharacterized protein n=1 Tax=Bipolaris victoriae (strain FI3) TaxID=930091 RepID=W7ED43_BIPV3|nr:hypothetical protein COCVIDRAFT_95737 [Bipolaris victoriae FI3]